MGISPFFVDYKYNPRLGIEPTLPKLPHLSDTSKRKYFKPDAITEHFNQILQKLKVLTRQPREKYEKNASSIRSEAPIYKHGDNIMISRKNLKCNQPRKK